MGKISREKAEYEARKEAIRRKRMEQKRKENRVMLKRVLVLFCIAAIITVSVLSVTVFFPVKTIAVEGQTVYTAEQIISHSGVKAGQNLWMTGGSAEESITKALPYISSVTVKRKFPSKIILAVKAGSAALCYKTDKGYLLCDSSNKLLEIKEELPADLLQIIGSTAKATEQGNIVSFEKTEKSTLINKIKSALDEKAVKVSMIDITDDLNIFLNVEGDRFSVAFGSSGNIEAKVAHLAQMIEKIDVSLKGTIDLSYWSVENPRGIFTQK